MKQKTIKFLFILVLFSLFAPESINALMNPVLKVENADAEKQCLYAGDIYQQEFTSPVETFGIVAVQFDNNNRINEDIIKFRIREAGLSVDEVNWYYQGEALSEQFQPGWYFPFGFPPFENAKDKNFIFEIESTQGKEDNCVSVYISKETKDLNFYVANEVPAKQLITNDIQRKFNEDKIFFISWGILVLLFAGYIIKK